MTDIHEEMVTLLRTYWQLEDAAERGSATVYNLDAYRKVPRGPVQSELAMDPDKAHRMRQAATVMRDIIDLRADCFRVDPDRAS